MVGVAYKYAEDKDLLLNRLKRIEGQVRGIARMVDEDTYCVDVLTQISAAISALEKVGMHLLADHIKGCVTDAVSSGNGEQSVNELVGVVERFLKA
jgi:CsoR family transcriptional regulator, copper-sensing transcriptional repressor